eukprot:Seg2861.5 transcript_id=Seg2861.5/GoldUCD/mRNA.D3Y31 product="TNF receptor-associated factor 3" protein_id=Seg2861.5/GoldUCD/D3Y31
MPGFNVLHLLADGEGVIEDFTCSVCHLVLREPLQLKDGRRICTSCFEDEDQESTKRMMTNGETSATNAALNSKSKICFPDKFARRAILEMIVYCKYREHGCQWIGPIADFEKHVETCEMQPKICPECGQNVTAKFLQWHLAEQCSERKTTCNFCEMVMRHGALENHQRQCSLKPVSCGNCDTVLHPEEVEDHQKISCEGTSAKCPFDEEGCKHEKVMTKGELHKHIETIVAFHILLLFARIRNIKKSITDLFAKLTVVKDEAYSKIKNLAHLVKDIESKILHWTEFVKKQLQKIWEEMSMTKNISLECRDELRAVITENKRLSKELSELGSKVFAQQTQLCEQINAFGELQGQCQPVMDKVEALRGGHYELKNELLKVSGKAPQLNLPAPVDPAPGSLDYHVSYNGTLIWKISNVTRKRQEAILKKTPSIISPPFFSEMHGYQSAVRLYLHGDGPARGEYMSLFFAVMKGPYDALLEWPFKLKVVMTLLDQDNVQHHTESFRPDLTSVSFQRPKKDINIASGSPFFFSLAALDTFAYVRDDTMFIKVTVEKE